MPRFKPPHPTVPPSAAPSSAAGRLGDPFVTIGDLARDFGLTLRALRFYESKGMLAPERRGWTRLYTPADRSRLAVIVQGKKLGLSLREIRETLERQGDELSGSATLRLSRDEVSEKIAALEAQKREIEHALAGLREHGSVRTRSPRRRAA